MSYNILPGVPIIIEISFFNLYISSSSGNPPINNPEMN